MLDPRVINWWKLWFLHSYYFCSIYIYIYIYICIYIITVLVVTISLLGFVANPWSEIVTTMWDSYNHVFVEVPVVFRRCPWCNGYCCRKWTQRHKFQSSMRLIAFHIALIPLRKVWIQLFSLQLWVNSRAD